MSDGYFLPLFFFFFQAEDGIRDLTVTGVQTCALPIWILPLYYTERGGDLYFASEIKALLASGEVERALDPEGLDEVFTFWAARPPRTPFRGIPALEPGGWARWRGGTLSIRRYYAAD